MLQCMRALSQAKLVRICRRFNHTPTTPQTSTQIPSDTAALINSFKWEEVGLNNTLLVYDSQEQQGSTSIAAFDLDGTLIQTKSGHKFPKDKSDWRWVDDNVKQKLKEQYKKGSKIVIFTNQAGIERKLTNFEIITTKLADMARDIGVPLPTFVATADNLYRKPHTTMWEHFCKHSNQGIVPDLQQCIYVGDAAGRKSDFSCSDRKFAHNIGIEFKTPQEFFKEESPSPWDWDSLDPFKFIENCTKRKVKDFEGPQEEIVSAKQEMIIMVGIQASGKTTFVKRHLLPNGYVHINRDTLNTQGKCLEMTRTSLSEGKRVVIDNTNPDVGSRKKYIDLARPHGIPVRCFVSSTIKDLALHLNFYRERVTNGSVEKIPEVAYRSFMMKYMPPSLNEGFSQIRTINFIPEFNSIEDKKFFFQRS